MKRYLVFAGSHHNKVDGWDAYCGDFDNLGTAKAHMEAERAREVEPHYTWGQVIDTQGADGPEVVHEV